LAFKIVLAGFSARKLHGHSEETAVFASYPHTDRHAFRACNAADILGMSASSSAAGIGVAWVAVITFHAGHALGAIAVCREIA